MLERLGDGEWLAVYVGKSQRNAWKGPQRDPVRCANVLEPREQDSDGKSAWAYVHGRDGRLHPSFAVDTTVALCTKAWPVPSIARMLFTLLRPTAACEMHAVAKFVLDQHRGHSNPLVHVLGVRRVGGFDKLIGAEAQTHAVRAYDHTHRGLMLHDDSVRAKVVKEILDCGPVTCFELVDFTLAEVRPLLRKLVDAALIRPEFHDDALALLAE